MSESPVVSTPSVESRRRWFQWHRSTWVFLVLFCVPYGMIALPSATFDDKNERYQSVWLHGWPTVHCAQIEFVGLENVQAAREKLDRDLFHSQDGLLIDWQKSSAENDGRWFYGSVNAYIHNQTGVQLGVTPQKFWSDSRNWKLWSGQRVSRYFPLGVTINLASFALYVILLGGLMEFLRRRKKRWYQVTLLEFGFLIALVGCGTAVFVRAQHDVVTKTEAITDLVQSGSSQRIGRISIHPPVWFERLTNLSFDMEARGVWFGTVYSTTRPSSIPLPYFAKVDRLELSRITDPEKAISAVERLQPNSLTITLHRQYERGITGLIEGVNLKGVEFLELDIPREIHGGSFDVGEDFLRKFDHIESIRFTGDVRLCHVIAVGNTSVKNLAIPVHVDEAMLEEIVKMEGLHSLSMSVPDKLMPVLKRLPRSLRYLDLGIVPSANDSVYSVDFRHLPDLESLNYLSLGIPLAGNGLDSNVVLGNLARYTKLQSLRLLPYTKARNPQDSEYDIGEAVDVPTLADVGMEYRTLPALRTLEIGPFAFDGASLDWIKSHKQLKQLFLHRRVHPEVREQMKTELPHVEQW